MLQNTRGCSLASVFSLFLQRETCSVSLCPQIVSVCVWTGQETKCHGCNCRTSALVPAAQWYLNDIHQRVRASTTPGNYTHTPNSRSALHTYTSAWVPFQLEDRMKRCLSLLCLIHKVSLLFLTWRIFLMWLQQLSSFLQPSQRLFFHYSLLGYFIF